MIKLRSSIAGRFTLTIRNLDTGKSRCFSFDNLITNQGLDYLVTNPNWARYCSVGASSTPPTTGDTQLNGFIASRQTDSWSDISGNFLPVTSYNDSSPYESTHTGEYTFPLGGAEGNLSEIGIGSANDGTQLFSRALIKDAMGDPTTITVLSNEILIVTYTLTVYPPIADSSGTINGYDYTARAAFVGREGGVGLEIGAGWSFNFNNFQGWDKRSVGLFDYNAMFVLHTGTLGVITSGPSGSIVGVVGSSGGGQITNDTYVAGSRARSFTVVLPTSTGNVTFQSVRFNIGVGCYQVQFSPAIEKDDTKEFTFSWSISWDRL